MGFTCHCVPLLWGTACCLWLAPFRDVLKRGTELGNQGKLWYCRERVHTKKAERTENVPARLKLPAHTKKLQFYIETTEGIQRKNNPRSEKLSLLLGSKDFEQKSLQKSASCKDMSDHTSRPRGGPGATFTRSQPKADNARGCLLSLHQLMGASIWRQLPALLLVLGQSESSHSVA